MSVATNLIQETSDYERFQVLDANRKINKAMVQKLIRSIEDFGFIQGKPIEVNEHFQVIDGQHRLEALKKLDMPVPYIVVSGANAQHALILNITNRSWSLEDFLNYFVKTGVKQYRDFNDLHEEYPSYSIGILTGIISGYKSHGQHKRFREGLLPEFDVPTATARLEQLDALNEINPVFVTRSAVEAWLTASNTEGFDPDLFAEILRKRGGIFTLHMRYVDNLREIEHMYNSGTGKKIRLL